MSDPVLFAGQNVGVTQMGERIWLVTFMRYDLGYFDDETCRLEPIENPFGTESVTIFFPHQRLRFDSVARADPAPRPYLHQALTLARFEPGMYEIVRTFSPLVG